MAPVQDSRKGFSEDDYNVTVADKDVRSNYCRALSHMALPTGHFEAQGEIKKMLLKLKEVGKAPEFVAQQVRGVD